MNILNKILITLFCLLTPIGLFSKEKYKLSVCAIFQNESEYLKEWIDYHRKVGVDHFYLYNNNSTDDYKKVLEPYIKKRIVELYEWPSVQEENDWSNFSFNIQPKVYNDALKRSKSKSKWLAIIDTDEFIVPVCEKNIVDVLEKHYGWVSGLCVNWQCYGTSYVKKVLPGEMLKKLILKMREDHPRNIYYKSIVRPSHVLQNPNPHYCIYLEGYCHVNTNYEPIVIENTGIYIDKIRINHYWTRDEWFLENVKIPRYEKWGISADAIRNSVEEMNQIEDGIIIQYL